MAKLQYRVVSYRPDHAHAWRVLNEDWITEGGFHLEAKDHLVLGDPEGAILSKAGHIFMAESEDGAAVGCCALMKMDDGGLELGKMTVTPSARGAGLSKMLMQACIDKGREMGAARLYLETNSALIPALKLYEQFGFGYLPMRETPYARADVFMEMKLT